MMRSEMECRVETRREAMECEDQSREGEVEMKADEERRREQKKKKMMMKKMKRLFTPPGIARATSLKGLG